MNQNDRCLDNDANRVEASPWRKFTYFGELRRGLSLLRRRDTELPQIVSAARPTECPLSRCQAGDRVQILALNSGEASNRLMGMGLLPGAMVDVVSSTTTGSVILALNDQRLGVSAEMAERIQVSVRPMATQSTATQLPSSQPDGEQPQPMSTSPLNQPATVKLREVAIGSTVQVIGYEPTARDYKRKLLAMGLTPGTEVRVTRHAPLGDPTEISVRGFQLSLRKTEADALIVIPTSGR